MEKPKVRRTMYGIHLTAPVDKWLAFERRPVWLDRDRATRFESMTAATITAIEIFELDPATFKVEAL
jgi:hypothetical protein